MHEIEIVLHDDSTIVIEEWKSDFCSIDGVDDESGAFEIDYSGTVDSSADERRFNSRINGSYANEMNFNSASVQQAAAITKAPLVMAANRAKTGLNEGANRARSGLNRSLAKLNGSATKSSETIKTNNHYKDIHMDPTPETSESQDEEQGGASSKEYSRRLVEYFVVVSSVPKFRESAGTDRQAEKVRDDSQKDILTPKLTNKKSPTSAHGANQPLPPPPPKVNSGKITPREAARIDTRRGHLKDSFRPGESVLPVLSLPDSDRNGFNSHDETDAATLGRNLSEGAHQSISANLEHAVGTENKLQKSLSGDSQQSTKNTKDKFLRSMSEQKKKLNEQKKKMGIHATGLHQQLETKMKSINIGRTISTGLNSKQQQQQHDYADDDDDSSCSSFSNYEDSPSRFPASTTFQPSSASPTFAPRSSPSRPSPTDLPQRDGGATENIRMNGAFFLDSSREYNDDIDDCILEPVITAQYPPIDRPDQPLNPMLINFCYPQGVESLVPLHEFKMPKIHHFVLTDSKGGKLYGTCLTVYEEFFADDEENDCDDISLASVRAEDQDRNYVECSMNGSPTVRRHRRRSMNHKYYTPRVLCLLSTWPYLSAFRTYLTQLYRQATTTSLMTAPLERYILNICEEVPAPPPGSFEVQLSILETNIRFWAPPADQPIPYVSLQYGVLFECLDIGNVLFAWYNLACERKILLVSSQLSLLTVCAEILCSMLFPMRWSHLYIPVLPRFLTPMLDAPMPYLCGISRENFPHAVGDISDETVVVDLDRNLITMGSQTPDLPILPQRRKLKLEAALEKHAGQVFWKARGLTKADVENARASGDENFIAEMLGRADAVWDEQICVMDEAYYMAHSPDSMSILYDTDDTPLDRKQSRWDAVQEAFLRFYVAMLKDYRKYLPSTMTEQSTWRAGLNSNDPRFLADEFVASQRPDFQPFLEELVSTQQFDAFVTRRMYNAGKAPDVTFFDQSIDAKKNRSKLRLKKLETPFLHSANAHRIMKRIDAVEPNRQDLPHDRVNGYIYPTWPESFDESLFGQPRPIPKIITAEFDRRAALQSMLKEKRGVVEESRMSGSYNPSPETTAFVLFFVMFSQIIGRDWDSFKKQHQNMLDDGFGFEESTDCDDSARSSGPWQPEINPPWMADEKTKQETNPAWMSSESFKTMHSFFRPQERDETVVNEEREVSRYNNCCLKDCDNFCTEKVIDPSTFIGMPWAQNSRSNSLNVEPKCNIGNGPIDEDFENELTKARSVAKAQVDLGVNTLKMMRHRKLASEAIMYKSLIEACGRCGIAHRAAQLLEMMTQDGLALDSEVYYCFINAFAHGDTDTTTSSHHNETMSEMSAYAPSAASGMSSVQARRTSGEFDRRNSSAESSYSRVDSYDVNASIGSKLSLHSSRLLGGIHHVVSSSLEENKRAFKHAKSKRMNRLFKRTLTKEKNLIVTKSVRTHLDLSNCILEDLYPGLLIDADSDTCPKCSCVLGQDNIILGWTPCEIKDFSTTCPSCKHRFVPKFSVTCSLDTFEGSQGEGTTLFVDYLSPWVLLRQIRNIIAPSSSAACTKVSRILGVDDNDARAAGVEAIIDPAFREGSGINATLWWNIIVTFKRFKIPYTFLLQGSFPDQQLIMPTLDDM